VRPRSFFWSKFRPFKERDSRPAEPSLIQEDEESRMTISHYLRLADRVLSAELKPETKEDDDEVAWWLTDRGQALTLFLVEITTSPLPLHFGQREPFLLRPEPRHFGHFLAFMTVIQNFLRIEEKEYNTTTQAHQEIARFFHGNGKNKHSALSNQPTARRDFACGLPLGYASFTPTTRLNIQPASVLD
jgi:hypothetical protein